MTTCGVMIVVDVVEGDIKFPLEGFALRTKGIAVGAF